METHSPAPSFSTFDSSGFVKVTVYREREQNLNELGDRIVRAAQCVTSEILASTWPETENRH